MIINKDDVGQTVGVAYKMHMHRLIKKEKEGSEIDLDNLFHCVEVDAVRMIKASANVMDVLEADEPCHHQSMIEMEGCDKCKKYDLDKNIRS